MPPVVVAWDHVLPDSGPHAVCASGCGCQRPICAHHGFTLRGEWQSAAVDGAAATATRRQLHQRGTGRRQSGAARAGPGAARRRGTRARPCAGLPPRGAAAQGAAGAGAAGAAAALAPELSRQLGLSLISCSQFLNIEQLPPLCFAWLLLPRS